MPVMVPQTFEEISVSCFLIFRAWEQTVSVPATAYSVPVFILSVWSLIVDLVRSCFNSCHCGGVDVSGTFLYWALEQSGSQRFDLVFPMVLHQVLIQNPVHYYSFFWPKNDTDLTVLKPTPKSLLVNKSRHLPDNAGFSSLWQLLIPTALVSFPSESVVGSGFVPGHRKMV